ncbi:MAG: papain-like cysteine protease family protein [Pyrinomonadaceae bacterium]
MPRVKYNVEMVSQQYSPTCWLACAAMLIQFKRHFTPSAEQLGITNDTDFRARLTSPDYGWECMNRLRRLGFTNARSSELPVNHRSPSKDMIYELLTLKGPFILHHRCGAFWYGPGRTVPTSDNSHAVLIVGIDTERDGPCVWFNNPWGQTDVMTTSSSIVNAISNWERFPTLKSISYL